MGVYLHIYKAFLFALCRLFALFLFHGFAEKLQVHIVTYRLHMAVLLCSENISRSAYFKVAHGNFKARTELRILSYCRKAPVCYLG